MKSDLNLHQNKTNWSRCTFLTEITISDSCRYTVLKQIIYRRNEPIMTLIDTTRRPVNMNTKNGKIRSITNRRLSAILTRITRQVLEDLDFNHMFPMYGL